MSRHPQTVLNYAAEDGEGTRPASGLSAILMETLRIQNTLLVNFVRRPSQGHQLCPVDVGSRACQSGSTEAPLSHPFDPKQEKQAHDPLGVFSKWNSKVSSSHEEAPVLPPGLGFCCGFWSHFRPARSEQRGKPGPKNPETSSVPFSPGSQEV